MKTKLLTFCAAVLAMLSSSCTCESQADVTYEVTLGKVPMTAVYKNGDDTTWSVWGASMVRDDEGLYHIFYSRWPKQLGWSWVVDSEIAHATSTSPYGPWEFKDVTLPRRGKEYWDGWCTHNPTIHRFSDGKYYLYYMGNTGDGEIVGYPGKEVLNWQHRNNQRIGVAVADHPNGPWTRFDTPLIDVSQDDEAYDCLVVTNPSTCEMADGRFLFIYKSVSKRYPLPSGGPVVHMVATSDSPTGPVTKYDELVFHFEGERFPAEDPYIWYGEGRYRAIVKRIKETGGQRLFSLVYYESEDGMNWFKPKYHELSDREITWENGVHQNLTHLERPQVYFEDGEPKVLLCAADTTDANNVRHAFNVQIPLNIKRHKVEATNK